MPIETLKVTLDSDSYQITRLGAVQGRSILLRLVKTIGPALAATEKGDGFAGVLVTALESIKEEDFSSICDALAANTRVIRGEKMPLLSDVFDAHFAGRYGAMLAWLIEALRINFASFFDEMQTLLPRKQAEGAEKAGSVSKSPTGSTGLSGEF